jgi:hypothetical protein
MPSQAATRRLEPATSDRASELAEELRHEADSAEATAKSFEDACADIGMRLGEAAPRLSELAAMFETLSNALDGEETRAAATELRATSDELASAADALGAEGGALNDLVCLNFQIGGQIANLSTFVRALSAVVFRLKIESARFQEGADDMTAFAAHLHGLAESSNRSIADYQTTHEALTQSLRKAAQSQWAFQHAHAQSMRAIAAEIHQRLGEVADRRRRTAGALTEVSGGARDISNRIGECVIALQIGDRARQRVKHVRESLRLWADVAEGDCPDLVEADTQRLLAADADRFAGRLCGLQASQLEGAYEDIKREVETVFAALDSLSADSVDLVQRGRALFGAGTSVGGSFLENLEQKLAAAHAMVDKCQRARAVVDHAARAAIATMSDLHQRTHALLEIVGDVSMIGTNALLKAYRLGDRGRGIGLIAHELCANSDQIARGIRALPPALDGVVARVETLTKANAVFSAGALSRLDERMSASLRVLGAKGGEMTAALKRLDREAADVHAVLARATAMLVTHKANLPALSTAAETLSDASGNLGGAAPHPAADSELDRLLHGAYTMACERQIHDASSAVWIPFHQRRRRKRPTIFFYDGEVQTHPIVRGPLRAVLEIPLARRLMPASGGL